MRNFEQPKSKIREKIERDKGINEKRAIGKFLKITTKDWERRNEIDYFLNAQPGLSDEERKEMIREREVLEAKMGQAAEQIAERYEVHPGVLRGYDRPVPLKFKGRKRRRGGDNVEKRSLQGARGEVNQVFPEEEIPEPDKENENQEDDVL